MKIYLVRHGESEGNKARIHQSPETPLTAEGVKQAENVAKRVAGLPIDFIYSSSLRRAKQTSEIIAEKKKIPVETWSEIREITRPSMLLGKHAESPEAKKYNLAMKEKRQDPDWKFSDDESFNDLKSRAKRVLDHLIEKHQDSNVLLVSHGTFIKMLISVALYGDSLTPDMFWVWRHNVFIRNTGISICEYSKDRGWSLISWNDMPHL